MNRIDGVLTGTSIPIYFFPMESIVISCRFSNILTDFVDAEVFFIDGDSLLLEILAESTLDWTHGGQFLHLTFLFERFLQYFTEKGGQCFVFVLSFTIQTTDMFSVMLLLSLTNNLVKLMMTSTSFYCHVPP